jgi:hypothetical protein
MYHQSLPGFCSAHWVIFVTATCCTNEKTDDENLTDCERVERLYEDTMYVNQSINKLNEVAKSWLSETPNEVGSSYTKYGSGIRAARSLWTGWISSRSGTGSFGLFEGLVSLRGNSVQATQFRLQLN